MQPLLGGPAALGVHQLVLGDEQARKGGQRDKASERRRRWSDRQGEHVTAQDTERVQRMPHPFPKWQTTLAVEVELVNQHG